MLSIFQKENWEVSGVEPSGSGNVAKERGIKIYKSIFEKAELPKNYFDVVILNHTLEHVDDPLKVLQKVKTILKSGGICLVDVPDFGGFSAQIMKSNWPFLVPNEHTFQFTKETLSKIFVKAGFKIVYIESRAGLWEFASPIGEIWEAVKTLKKRVFKELLFLPYDTFVTLMGRGNSMTIVGRKE
jgi:SAM-dependent methyltransferase